MDDGPLSAFSIGAEDTLDKFNWRDYARAGATARLREIEDERAAILAAFPDLRGARSSKGRPRRLAAASPTPPATRKRRRLSAAARRRISEAQKKRWAEQKAKKAAK